MFTELSPDEGVDATAPAAPVIVVPPATSCEVLTVNRIRQAILGHRNAFLRRYFLCGYTLLYLAILICLKIIRENP